MNLFLEPPLVKYPKTVLSMLDTQGYFDMFEGFKKIDNNTNLQAYELCERVYTNYFGSPKYSNFETFKTVYFRKAKNRNFRKTKINVYIK